MKGFVLSVLFCGIFCVANVQAQDCNSGQCRPVRNLVSAAGEAVGTTVRATRDAVQNAVTTTRCTTQKVAAAPRRLLSRVAWRVRCR
jgi:hypothetical protein